jgi:hypothetical protein
VEVLWLEVKVKDEQLAPLMQDARDLNELRRQHRRMSAGVAVTATDIKTPLGESHCDVVEELKIVQD